MAGWSHKKRTAVEKAFYQYLDRCWVNSKDLGRICLGEHLYWGQRWAITQIFDALERDIHTVDILKSRQLGISTLIRALIIFLLGIHHGLKGAIVFDTDGNKQEARAEIEVMIDDLPASLKFPDIKGNNRAGLTLRNDSKVLFMSAGVRKTKTSGTLGRSVGLSLAHCSELCSWDNDDGWEAFKNSLSEINPDRLYIKESTARGYNMWHAEWSEDRKDPEHVLCIFLGWWSKESQRIEKSEPDFLRYGVDPPTEREVAKIKAVREQYGFEVAVEQLAWYRRKTDPSQILDEDVDPLKIQEQPWCVIAGTRVGTSSQGIVPIEEISKEDQCSQGKIIAGGSTGKAKIWRIRTKLGYEFSGTANHPIVQSDGAIVDLSHSLGTRVRLQPPLLRSGIEPYEISWREPPAVCRVKVDEDLARFIGLFMGDGSASNTMRGKTTEVAIACCAQDLDVVVECERLFAAVFGIESTRRQIKGCITVRSGQKHIFNTLKKLDLLRNDTVKTMRKVHVPEFIWRSPKHIIKEFLKGLFEADGFNAYETNRVALFSKYPDFIKDIQLLLLAFGITSRSVSVKKKAGDGHYYTGNQLELRTAEALRFNAEIGFISARKIGRHDPVGYERMKLAQMGKRGNTRRPVILFEDEVVEVENTELEDYVYNLTVEHTNLFDANGILTHNTEEEAFQQTGAIFFANEKLTDQSNKNVDPPRWHYMYNTSAHEFTDLFVIKAQNVRSVELKVWEEPEHDAVYAFGCDPAFGESEDNDRSSIQILKCFADGCDQVAEYAWPLITTRQLSWVLASLMGWYGQNGARVHYCLELNGPGTAVLNGLKELKHFVEHGYRPREVKEKGLQDIFRNVHSYIYSRPDSIGVGTNVHFKTNTQLKVMLMERLRDFASQASILKIRSADTIEEMRTVSREGDSIKAPSSMRDDRVVALALATHCWETKIKRDLMSQKRTRESEAARKRLTISDQVYLFQQNQLEQFFKTKQVARAQARFAQLRAGVRFGSRRY